MKLNLRNSFLRSKKFTYGHFCFWSESVSHNPPWTVFVYFTILSYWCQIPEDISTGGLPLANDGQTGFDKVWKLFVLSFPDLPSL